MNKIQVASSAALFFALFTFIGCGGPGDQPELGTVTGRITYDGKPVAGYIVNFQPASGRPSVGSTDADGKYTLDYTLTTKGAKVGTHKVFLIFADDSDVDQEVPGQEDESSEDGSSNEPQAGLPPEARKLMKVYGGVQTTPLTAEVKGGENVVNFELKLDSTQAEPE